MDKKTDEKLFRNVTTPFYTAVWSTTYHLININKHHKENSFLKIALMLLQVLILDL